jgi:ABC-2 type transport system permease protein
MFTFIVAVFLPASLGLALPASSAGFVLFGVTLLTAFLLCTAWGMFLTAVRLGISWGEGPTYMLACIGGVLSGGYLPLQLWPDFMQGFLLFQPFSGMRDLPLRLYVGTMQPLEAVSTVALQLFWSALFVACGYFIMNRKLKKLIVQGG